MTYAYDVLDALENVETWRDVELEFDGDPLYEIERKLAMWLPDDTTSNIKRLASIIYNELNDW